MKKIFTLLFISTIGLCYGQLPTWSNSVSKIIYENCATCHRDGGIAPFSLTTYEDAVVYAQSIKSALKSGTMPPWSPDPNYKSFVHQRVMKDTDKQAVISWIDNNTASGDLRYAPTPPLTNSKSQLGTPDFSYKTSKFTVTSNQDMYHVFEIPSGITQTTYIKAFEVIPGNTKVVHHVLVFQDSSTNPIDPNSSGGTGSSASKLLFGYTPGAQPYYTPVGTGFKLDANTRIIVQIHYAPGSKDLSDETTVNFKTTTTKQREIFVTPLLNHSTTITDGPLFIPANTTKTFHAAYTAPINATLLFVFPHMHRVGKTVEAFATTPTGENIPMINIPKWDFHWQDSFVFPKAIKIPSGTVLKSSAFYDNTENNLDNPNSPPKDVSLGEGTNDEMMLVYFAYMAYQAGDENLIVDNRIIPSGATTFCEGQSVILRAINESGYTYQWYKDGLPIDQETTSTYEAKSPGQYTVSLTLGTNKAISEPVTIVVNPKPSPAISPSGTVTLPQGGNIQLQANAVGNYTYQWYKNDLPIQNATTSTYNVDGAGNYSVAVNDGCIGISNTTTVVDALGLNDIQSESKLGIFPNPSTGTSILKNAMDHQLTVIDLLGKVLFSALISSNEFPITLNNKGIYILKISNPKGENFYQKLIIE